MLQGRLLLEETYQAFENTATGPAAFSGQEVGAYVGCMYQEYSEVLTHGGGKLNAASATGNSLAFLVGRQVLLFNICMKRAQTTQTDIQGEHPLGLPLAF